MWEAIGLNAAGTLLVAGIFVALAGLLRFLYGPKGRFREAAWDADEPSAPVTGRAESEMGVPGLREAFEAYVLGFRTGEPDVDAQIDLKREHTFNVMAAAERIAEVEPVFADPVLRRALALAALFHDVGRFEQLAVYKTYADALSCNHALLGSKVLCRQGFLRREPARLRRLVRIAVVLHNRVTLPAGITGEARPVLEAVRDADKIDILRIMAGNLGPGGKPDPIVVLHLATEGGITPVIGQHFRERRTARYADMRTLNDFRLLLCTWLFEVRFQASLGVLAKSGHLDRVVDGMVGIPEVQAEARRLVEEFLGPFRESAA